jgi:hypothetical protein
MARLRTWPFAIFAAIFVWALIAIDAGYHRADWWFLNLFKPIAFRDVHVISVEPDRISLSYIPSDCEVLSFGAASVVDKYSGFLTVTGQTIVSEGDRARVDLDVDLGQFAYDEVRVFASVDCGGDRQNRLFATIFDATAGPAYPNYVGPEGGYGRD